jgi:hypothetical protein
MLGVHAHQAVTPLRQQVPMQESQEARFANVDSLLSGGASGADVLRALRPGKRSRPDTAPASSTPASAPLQAGCPPSQHGLAAAPARRKHSSVQSKHGMACLSASAPLTNVPGLRVSSRDVPVVALRDASGSIGKNARGAAAFLVRIKDSGSWLFLPCPSEV